MIKLATVVQDLIQINVYLVQMVILKQVMDIANHAIQIVRLVRTLLHIVPLVQIFWMKTHVLLLAPLINFKLYKIVFKFVNTAMDHVLLVKITLIIVHLVRLKNFLAQDYVIIVTLHVEIV